MWAENTLYKLVCFELTQAWSLHSKLILFKDRKLIQCQRALNDLWGTLVEVMKSLINKTSAWLSFYSSFLMALQPQPVVSVMLLRLSNVVFVHH